MCSLICAWINGWVNNRKAGDLRIYRAHYDVTVMITVVMTILYAGHCCASFVETTFPPSHNKAKGTQLEPFTGTYQWAGQSWRSVSTWWWNIDGIVYKQKCDQECSGYLIEWYGFVSYVRLIKLLAYVRYVEHKRLLSAVCRLLGAEHLKVEYSSGNLVATGFYYVLTLNELHGTAWSHYSDVIMSMTASQISSLTIVYSTVYSGAYQRIYIKAPRYWPLWGQFTGNRWIPRTKGQ